MRIYLVQIPDLNDPANLPTLIDNFQRLENLLNGRLQGDNIASGSLADAAIAPGSLHRVSFSDDVPDRDTGQYTGDGTANRIITVTNSFTPRHVVVLSHVDLLTFEAIGNGVGPMASWWRTATGALQSGLTDWQGCTTGGFKLGSALANQANKAGQLYSWFALR